MGPGFRYHVVTVAAIFFALTVGLVVGGLYVSPRLQDKQTRLVENLQVTVNRDVEGKTLENRRYKRCLETLMPSALRGRLSGKSFVILQTGDYPGVIPRLRDTLEMAGATVLSLMTIERNFDRPDELLKAQIETIRATDSTFPMDRNGLADALATGLAQGDAPSGGMLSALQREGFLRFDPMGESARGVNYVVIVAGRQMELAGRLTNVDQPIVLALQKRGIKVLMCEPQDAEFSDSDAYRKLGLEVTRIGNIDSSVGLTALVLAADAEPVDYGMRDSASDQYPPDPTQPGAK